MAVNHIRPVSPAAASGKVAEVYRRLRKDFLVVPPFSLHSPMPDILAGVACVCCETLCSGRVPRSLKEVVATGVSEVNLCPFCIEAHALSIDALVPAAGLIEEVVRGGRIALVDASAQSYLEWARATRTQGHALLSAPPFSSEEAPEVIGTALAFHYINRMVSVFADDSPLPLPKALGPLAGLVRKLGAPFIERVVARKSSPGSWLDVLSHKGDPESVGWARGNPTLACAFAGFEATVEAAAARFVPAEVRAAVSAAVSKWNGEEAPMGRAWVEQSVSAVEPALRPAATLGVLTALAAYRVDGSDIDCYRKTGAGDEAVIVVTSWSSLRATKRIAEWIQ